MSSHSTTTLTGRGRQGRQVGERLRQDMGGRTEKGSDRILEAGRTWEAGRRERLSQDIGGRKERGSGRTLEAGRTSEAGGRKAEARHGR